MWQGIMLLYRKKTKSAICIADVESINSAVSWLPNECAGVTPFSTEEMFKILRPTKITTCLDGMS